MTRERIFGAAAEGNPKNSWNRLKFEITLNGILEVFGDFVYLVSFVVLGPLAQREKMRNSMRFRLAFIVRLTQFPALINGGE